MSNVIGEFRYFVGDYRKVVGIPPFLRPYLEIHQNSDVLDFKRRLKLAGGDRKFEWAALPSLAMLCREGSPVALLRFFFFP